MSIPVPEWRPIPGESPESAEFPPTSHWPFDSKTIDATAGQEVIATAELYTP